ncbi:DUF5682 family protein [Actinomyces sp. oral taxon 171]|uniref:DUF5682 family protein n=2 Tax=Actinomyces sp. oral taxon 171 TaxID=706438 RepID=UPI0010FC2840|nr:DUF5682 family protein [Actinomyces sp. oral taxon 171]QCT33628.1 hypothetical protein FBF36_09325 [Actinomyces sp. oral taxon 171 str. F0337]
MSASTTQVPARLQYALDSQRRWGEAGVHLVPVRHHSPACALALSALLEEVHPATVLIEGPVEYAALLPSLQDPRTVPPVALLSLGERTASYYPLAEFSPEWVALRWAGQHGAEAAFIDRSACLRDDDDPRDDARGAVARTLQAERYLARSRSLDALARRLGCRDHDEVWEHLFEDRATADIRSWRGFFSDTLAWSGLARLDVEREVLDADGTHAREAVMSAALRRHLPAAAPTGAGEKGSAAPAAPVVVVTGGFHIMALLDCLDATEHAAWLPEPQPQPGGPAWLIRYDFARLDALRGYGAGMPSPGLWQRAWRARTGASPLDGSGTGPRRATRRTARPVPEPAGAARAFATTVVIDVATALRELGEPLGTAQVLATVEQAMRLAALRGRAWPGRCDILDALTSCLVKDETGLSGNLGAAVASVLAASDVGEVPDGIATPPLVRQVRDRLRAARFIIDDAVEHRVSLDTSRRPRHRERRELLARLRFVGSGFAHQISGADLVAGTGMGQFLEEWVYSWTPMVEAALVRAAQEAPDLDVLVRTRLAQRLTGELSAETLVALVSELAVMGLDAEAGDVCDRLENSLGQLSDLGELVEALHRLAGLIESTSRLRLDHAAARIRSILHRGDAMIARRLSDLVGLEGQEALQAVDALISVRDLIIRSAADDERMGEAAQGAGFGAVLRQIEVLRRSRDAAAVLVGCATGIAASVRALSQEEAVCAVVTHLAMGADPARAADFIVGLVRSAPDVLLHSPDAVEAVTGALTGLDDRAFVAALPDLRRAFTALRPVETHRLAEMVAQLIGAAASDLDTVWTVDPAHVALGSQIERDLVASLVRDGLGEWAG